MSSLAEKTRFSPAKAYLPSLWNSLAAASMARAMSRPGS
jgi:hypothetical protein